MVVRFKGYLYMLDEVDYEEPVLLDRPVSLEEYARLVGDRRVLSDRCKRDIIEEFKGDGIISFMVEDDVKEGRDMIYLTDILKQYAGRKVKITVEVLG